VTDFLASSACVLRAVMLDHRCDGDVGSIARPSVHQQVASV
jgi:hypothetical protein